MYFTGITPWTKLFVQISFMLLFFFLTFDLYFFSPVLAFAPARTVGRQEKKKGKEKKVVMIYEISQNNNKKKSD